MSEDDRSLIERVKKGDIEALNELINRHYRTIYRLGMGWLGDPGLADELTQDVLVTVWKKAAQYRGDASVARWITVMAHHHAISIRRKRHIQQWVSLDWAWPPPMVPDTSDYVGHLDTHHRLIKTLQQLDPVSRDIVVLKEMEGWSHMEIATHLNIASGTVRSKLSRAKAFIKRHHPELGDPHEPPL